jgi:6-phosphogluconate dehydrogenase
MAEIAIIGLGKMGANMATRLRQRGHRVVVLARTEGHAAAFAKETGAVAASALAELPLLLTAPRAVWVMVPSGAPTAAVVAELGERLARGDIVIDGGNSNYKESIQRANDLAGKGIAMLDVGTSGGIWGLKEGYCLMIGGDRAAAERLAPIFTDLAPQGGWLHVGPSGAGHFSKMVHNGVEYGMMQAYAEGFELLRASGYDYDLHRLARLWNRGSVVRSWLLELLEAALAKDATLAGIKGYVEDSGEGRWTVEESIARAVPAPVLTLALQMRFRSRQDDSFAAKICAALRNEFGGHATRKS